MTIYPQDSGTPEPFVPITAAGGAEAETFLRQEVRDARQSLTITRIASVVVSLGLMAYLGYVTHRFQTALEPHNAAEIAHGIIAQRVEEQAPAVAENIKTQAPLLIARIPDYALQQIPKYRQQLADKITGDLTTYASSTSAQLGTHLDDFLGAHQEEVREMIDNGQDKATVDRVGVALETEFLAYLKEPPAGGGESYQKKLDQSLEILNDTKAKMDRLANGKNLTPDELKARHAVAILATGIDQQRQSLTGGSTPTAQ